MILVGVAEGALQCWLRCKIHLCMTYGLQAQSSNWELVIAALIQQIVNRIKNFDYNFRW